MTQCLALLLRTSKIDNVVFENENGEVYGPYSHIATTFDTMDMKTLSFGLTRDQPFGDRSHVGQRWRYTVSWHRTEASREAVVTSRPRASEKVEVKMWTSLPLTVYVCVGPEREASDWSSGGGQC